MADNPFLKKATASNGGAVSGEARKKHGLGRGLDGLLTPPTRSAATAPATTGKAKAPAAATIPVMSSSPSPDLVTGATLVELPIVDIERSPYQMRRDFKQEELKELSDSLRNNGLVQPPTVRLNNRGRYELIAGERRLRAAQMAGWSKIRVTLISADDLTAAAMTTTENLQRENLNPIEEALSYKTLLDIFSLTQQEVAERVGKGRATVANSIRLLELPDEVKALVQNSMISVGHAKVLLSLEEEKDRVLFARDVVNEQMTVRALEKKVARLHNPPEVKKPGTPDLPENYLKNLTETLKKHLGCAVRVSSGVTLSSGRHTKGVLEIDFFNNDDLDRVLKLLGVKVE